MAEKTEVHLDEAGRPAPHAAAPIELDYLYNSADKLYAQFARSCGLSSCAYWMLYDLERAGGEAPLRRICSTWAYSKQTISSALKVLEARELIDLSYEEGSRKNKVVRLTPTGRAFSDENIVPAHEAEERAFRSLGEADGRELIALVRRYTRALEEQFAQMGRERDAG